MFDMHEIKCKECRSIIGYSDADYAPLILCKACANKENSEPKTTSAMAYMGCKGSKVQILPSRPE